MQTVKTLYREPTEDENINDTFIFEVKIYSTWKRAIRYKIKINPQVEEDYSTAWQRLKEILYLSYPAITNKEIRLIL